MMTHRPSDSRGRTHINWLDSRHSFSFGGYQDPDHLSFGSLRVINDDRVAGGAGFPTHPHRDMEILTYVVEGAVAHEDSMGNRKTVEAGRLQTMTAGTGITHSEFNPLPDQETRFLQIWITPREKGLTPGYAEWQPDATSTGLSLMASADGRDHSVVIQQDVDVYLFKANSNPNSNPVTLNPRSQRKQWLQVMTGSITLNGTELNEGDGAAIEKESTIELSGSPNASALFFDIG